MYCPNCGKELESDYKFCNKCGCPVVTDSEGNPLPGEPFDMNKMSEALKRSVDQLRDVLERKGLLKPQVKLVPVSKREYFVAKGPIPMMYDSIMNFIRIGQISKNVNIVTNTHGLCGVLLALIMSCTFNVYNIIWMIVTGILISNEYSSLGVKRNVTFKYFFFTVICWGYAWDLVELDTYELQSLKNGTGLQGWHLEDLSLWFIQGALIGFTKYVVSWGPLILFIAVYLEKAGYVL